MQSHNPSEDEGILPLDFDLSQIFIGREQQLDQFRYYLERWKMLKRTSVSGRVSTIPSPDDKIQGLVVFLHGRGGFGKSTLLRRYRELALEYNSEYIVSRVIDWEFAAQDRRALFNPAPGENVDALQYFNLLRDQLVIALNKQVTDFKEYQSAVNAVEDARKKANAVLDGLQHDDRYGWIRLLAGEGVLALVRLVVPKSEVILNNDKVLEKVKELAGEGMQIGIEQVKQVWSKLHDKLGSNLVNYLEPASRLGLGQGHDLASFARKHHLLIFFDTYEEIDEADNLLRLVMGTAGQRVGWVIAGRDNLWAGLSQRLRSLETQYGYKDIVPPDRRLVIDFSADGVGDFTLSDIEQYFAQIQALLPHPAHTAITEKSAAHILEVTQGVPLAVKIAATLYLEKFDFKLVTSDMDSKREIVDQMVRRYLLHTRANQQDRAKLYGLALLRRAEEPRAVSAAIELATPASYEAELSRLHRRYGFVFTKQGQPALHQEVRHFLRQWLLEHRSEPTTLSVNQRLFEVNLVVLQELEDQRKLGSLSERLEDEQWVGGYLDLIEQQFWLDPIAGVQFALPFMFAASIYRREANREVVKMGAFFEAYVTQPYRKHWEWAVQSLIYSTSHNPLAEELSGLEALAKLTTLNSIAFPPPLPPYKEELEAALWWRLGEAHRGRNDSKALEWFETSLRFLTHEEELRTAAAEVAWSIAQQLDEIRQPEEYLRFLNKVLELKPDFARSRDGEESPSSIPTFDELQEAIADFNHALELAPDNIQAYINRGKVYTDLKEYEKALADFDYVLTLDPMSVQVFINRGNLYQCIQEYEHALEDFDRAIELDPKSVLAYIGRGFAHKHNKLHEHALEDFDRAIELDPKSVQAYIGRGEARRLINEARQSLSTIESEVYYAPAAKTVSSESYPAPPQPWRSGGGYVDMSTAPHPPLTPASPQGQKPQRRFSPVITMLLIIIAVLIIAGSALIYYATVYQPSQQHAQATAIAQVAATAQARIKATATAAAANPYTHSGTLVFSDPLSDNSKGVIWAQDPTYCFFIGGAYHVKAPDPHFYDDCLAVDSNYTNFAFEAQMQIMAGDGGGLVFRDQDTPLTYRNYAIDVYQDESYDLYITSGSNTSALTSGNSSAIKQGVGQNNLVAVVAQGSTITIFINHQQITSITDSTFTYGKIGFEASPNSTNGHATEIVFSNVRVWMF